MTGSRETHARGWQPGVALLVAVTLSMEHLDGTILVTAAPQIAADFGTASADVNLAMTAYLIAVACAIPLGGWLASRFGARLVFCSSIALFTVASVACALSGSLFALTAARVVQGIAGGMMAPVGRLIVLRGTEKGELLRAIALITWPALLAPVLAPALGGVITELFSWHWIFLINVPVGIAAFVAALVLVRDNNRARVPLDWRGLLLLTGTALGVMTGVELVAAGDAALYGIAALIGAMALGAAATWWLLRAPAPLLDVRVLQTHTFRASNTGGFVFRLVVSSVPFLLPLLFQDGLGWSPIESGLAVTAVFIGNIGIKPLTSPVLRRWGFRSVIIAAGAGSILCLIAFSLFSATTPFWLVFAVAVLSGAFRSTGFTAYNSMQFADIAKSQLPSANTLSATLAQLATGLGIAVGATVLRVAQPIFEGADELAPYRAAFVAVAALCVASVLNTIRLAPDAAADVARRPAR
ncbi:MFS transporter [Ruicaihuangia caeni]|uniref:MFS transporter n=1 Tax=Ruicaihuangia caeni TaxID=3042517 RepID=A0AAW6T9H5_9MICO|nr:MFS transporter [Klugiella sp. YN-L-19]MDI2098418.1 MFS transporter [Klugiella sp. YN-L-19]